MLTSLRIQNFKSWKDTGPIRLAPITVFFGANSAGKTSLLQFLLMLKQTTESSDRHRVMHFGDDNSLVDLGTFQDLIFEHDTAHRIEFDLAWKLPEPRVFGNRLKDKATNLRFDASIASDGDRQYVRYLRYRTSGTETSAEVRMHTGGGKAGGYKVAVRGYNLGRKRSTAWRLPAPVRFYGFPGEIAAAYQNSDFTSDLALELEHQMGRVAYLGPLREAPKRSYTWTGDVPEHVGRDGNGTVAALLAAGDRKLTGGLSRRARPFQSLVAEWLKRLGLLDSFTARKIAPNRKDYEVRVRTRGSSKDVDLTDVGFGISQVLPVVVESFYAPPHSTVIIEQPELHLHPRVQSELADLFIDAIHARENGVDRDIQFIVESHSEHFLQRLQRRIAEKELNREHVALYFCEPGSKGSILHELELNQFGDVANWPEDFFGDPMEDLSARMTAASEREKEMTQ